MVYKSNKAKRLEIKTKRRRKNNAWPRPVWDKENRLRHIPSYLETFDADTSICRDPINLSRDMQQVIHEGYEIFSIYAPPERFAVCLFCCMSVEEEYALRSLPLCSLPQALIYQYNTSAKADLFSKNEVAYLLPRILELITLGEMVHHSQELNLVWIAQVPKVLWSKKEVDFLDRFALAYFKNSAEQALANKTLVLLEEILIMFYRAGININPLLGWLAETANIYLTLSLAELLAKAKSKDRILINAFAQDCPEINDRLNSWLERDKNKLKDRANEVIASFDKVADQCLGYYEYVIEEIVCDLSEGRWF